MKLTYILSLILSALMFTSCEDDDINPAETGSITIEFDNKVGNDELELNKNYTNASGEIFKLTKLNYYISNIKLRTVSGTEYAVPQDSSYFLVMEDVTDSHEVTIKNVPAGDYNEITFTMELILFAAQWMSVNAREF